MTRPAVDLVSYSAVLLAGLIAGLLLGTSMDHNRLAVLGAEPWTVARQSIDGLFSRALPWFWNITLLMLFFAVYVNAGRSRWLFLTAGLLLLMGIVLTIAIEVPINKAIASWSPEAVPANWMELRSRWLNFHYIRTLAGMAAFALSLAGVIWK